VNLICWNCGEGLDDIPRPISRHATCSQCFNELHCCRLCRHYDAKRNMQCFEDRADPPLQKENANFCDFFAPQTGAFQEKTATKTDAARSELGALFSGEADESDFDVSTGEPSEADLSEEQRARKKLDDLFG